MLFRRIFAQTNEYDRKKRRSVSRSDILINEVNFLD